MSFWIELVLRYEKETETRRESRKEKQGTMANEKGGLGDLFENLSFMNVAIAALIGFVAYKWAGISMTWAIIVGVVALLLVPQLLPQK